MRRTLVEDLAISRRFEVVTTLDPSHSRLSQDLPARLLTIGPGEERGTLERLAKEMDAVLLIAPETGGVLAERVGWIEGAGGRSLGCSQSAINLSGDKLALAEFLTAKGIPCIPTRRFDPARGLDAEASWPIVLKPIDGAGSVDAIVVDSPAKLPAWTRTREDLILQPLMPGTPLAATYIVRPGGVIQAVGVARQRIERRFGRLTYKGGTVPISPHPADDVLRRALAAVPGMLGWIGVDYLWDETSGNLVLVEINPRLTTSYVGFRRLWPPGELARALVETVLDPKAKPLAPPSRTAPVCFASDGTVETAWIGLDIGGANLKAAHTSGDTRVLPFELWKRPEELPRVLAMLVSALPPADRLALTMTAELCDCYDSKAEGVTEVLGAVLHVAEQRMIRVWGTDSRLHSVTEILAHPELAAAANWLALATFAARLGPPEPGLLIDIGSTTTDLIPIHKNLPVPRGRTDTDRLAAGELLYAGVRRTPVCALISELPFRGQATGVAAELFATTLDVYITLGMIAEDTLDTLTADGRPATRAASRDRLARMIGADRSLAADEDTYAMARAVDDALIARLETAARRAASSLPRHPTWAVVAGSGEFLARRLAAQILPPDASVFALEDAWGPIASVAGCAYALVLIAGEHDQTRAANQRVLEMNEIIST